MVLKCLLGCVYDMLFILRRIFDGHVVEDWFIGIWFYLLRRTLSIWFDLVNFKWKLY